MVTQVQWEDDVIWNGDEVRQQVLSSMSERGVTAGWIPTCNSRTAEQYAQQGEQTFQRSLFSFLFLISLVIVFLFFLNISVFPIFS